MVTLPCGNCAAPIRLKLDRWARRRVRGRWKQVCAKCATDIDAQAELDLEVAELHAQAAELEERAS